MVTGVHGAPPQRQQLGAHGGVLQDHLQPHVVLLDHGEDDAAEVPQLAHAPSQRDGLGDRGLRALLDDLPRPFQGHRVGHAHGVGLHARRAQHIQLVVADPLLLGEVAYRAGRGEQLAVLFEREVREPHGSAAGPRDECLAVVPRTR